MVYAKESRQEIGRQPLAGVCDRIITTVSLRSFPGSGCITGPRDRVHRIITMISAPSRCGSQYIHVLYRGRIRTTVTLSYPAYICSSASPTRMQSPLPSQDHSRAVYLHGVHGPQQCGRNRPTYVMDPRTRVPLRYIDRSRIGHPAYRHPAV